MRVGDCECRYCEELSQGTDIGGTTHTGVSDRSVGNMSGIHTGLEKHGGEDRTLLS